MIVFLITVTEMKKLFNGIIQTYSALSKLFKYTEAPNYNQKGVCYFFPFFQRNGMPSELDDHSLIKSIRQI